MIKQYVGSNGDPVDCLDEAVRVLARSPGTLLQRLEDAYMDALRFVDLEKVPEPHRHALSSIVSSLRPLTSGGEKEDEAREVMQGDASLEMVDQIFAIRDAMVRANRKAFEKALKAELVARFKQGAS